MLSACVSVPENIQPVKNFKVEKYMGKWYEIARLDHRFEKNMESVSAEYALNEDGTVSVLNTGFLSTEKVWKSIKGKAKFAGIQDEGFLKVSFFGPFYGSYIIFDLDQTAYQYAFIAGPNTDYLWLLSRTPTVNKDVIQRFENLATEKGFNTQNIIYVKQQNHSNSF